MWAYFDAFDKYVGMWTENAPLKGTVKILPSSKIFIKCVLLLRLNYRAELPSSFQNLLVTLEYTNDMIVMSLFKYTFYSKGVVQISSAWKWCVHKKVLSHLDRGIRERGRGAKGTSTLSLKWVEEVIFAFSSPSPLHTTGLPNNTSDKAGLEG